MNFKPILFSTPMIQAILDGRKTQTRRTIKPQPVLMSDNNHFNWNGNYYLTREQLIEKCKIQKGDVLWARETFEIVPVETSPVHIEQSNVQRVLKYKADCEDSFEKWKPSIYMPKKACRIFLEVTDVRVERLQDISESDAIAEGIKKTWIADRIEMCAWKNYINDGRGSLEPISSFESLWESINGKESWNKNPWDWVYDFKKIEKPENFI